MSPTNTGARRPNRSDIGPMNSCPTAPPMRVPAIVNCTCDIPVPSSVATSGSEGRYMSVVRAPRAAIEPRSRTHLVIETRRARASARTFRGAVLVRAVIEGVSPGIESFRVRDNFATVRGKSKRFARGLWRGSHGGGVRRGCGAGPRTLRAYCVDIAGAPRPHFAGRQRRAQRRARVPRRGRAPSSILLEHPLHLAAPVPLREGEHKEDPRALRAEVGVEHAPGEVDSGEDLRVPDGAGGLHDRYPRLRVLGDCLLNRRGIRAGREPDDDEPLRARSNVRIERRGIRTRVPMDDGDAGASEEHTAE